jgi:hypothetical protein
MYGELIQKFSRRNILRLSKVEDSDNARQTGVDSVPWSLNIIYMRDWLCLFCLSGV